MSKFFINRPIVAMVIAILTVIIGAVAIVGLPVAQFPQIAPPEVQVSAIYVGADAQTIEQSVATPIEQQMSGVDNMNYMYSLNATANGQMRLIVNFDVATDPNTDLILAQSRETQAASQLPADVNNYGVTVQKSVLAPLMLVALNSPKSTYDARFLANYAYINLDGPADAREGRRHRAGLRRRPIRHAPVGEARPVGEAADHRSRNCLRDPDAEHRQSRRTGGQRADSGRTGVHLLGSRARPAHLPGGIRTDRDSRDSRYRHRAREGRGASGIGLARLQRDRPPGRKSQRRHRGLPVAGIKRRGYGRRRQEAVRPRRSSVSRTTWTISIPVDTTRAVNEGIKEIVETLLIAIVLVVAVVYLFLQGWRSTLIPLLAVPVSLVGTFVFFPLFGFSINTLSLFGLVLAIGLVVDDAIVVVEAVERHIEEGLSPKEAALKAMEEISGPVIGIALVLSAVFVPTAFIPGITGRLYQQFAVTIAISVILSAFNALSLSPALAALILKPKNGEQRTARARFFAWFNRSFERATNGYVRVSGALLRKSCRRRGHAGRLRRRRLVDRRQTPSQFRSRRGPGLLLHQRPAPEFRFAPANRRGHGESCRKSRPRSRASSMSPPFRASAC